MCLVLLAACESVPHYRGGPSMTGSFAETTIGVGNVGTIAERWRRVRSTDGSSPTSVTSGDTIFDAVGAYDDPLGADCAVGSFTCAPKWTWQHLQPDSHYSAPTAWGDYVFFNITGKDLLKPQALVAYDAHGVTNCSGAPKVCAPVRVAGVIDDSINTAYGVRSSSPDAPVVADGIVYINNDTWGSIDAYDAAGKAECDQLTTVVMCHPLWRALGVWPAGAPAVVAGVAYITVRENVPPLTGLPNRGGLLAYDAKGTTNCTGSHPRTCQPLWTAPVGDGHPVDVSSPSPAVAGGLVYGTIGAYVYALDAAGVAGCSGTPKVCTPRWTATPPGVPFGTHLTVAGGRLFVSTQRGIEVYDAAGDERCSGTPRTCQPIASDRYVPAGSTTPAPITGAIVANGVVYGLTPGSAWWDWLLVAFDATAVQGCSGAAPIVCSSLLTGPVVHTEGGALSVGRGRIASGVNVYAPPG